MSASNRRLSFVNKSNRKPTPLNLERLEARMLCTVNNLFDSLNLLGSSSPRPTAKTVVAALINQAPTIASNVTAVGGTQVSGKEVRFSALGNDDKGEANLLYSWKVTEAPAGATANFTANNANNAKNTTLNVSTPGVYGVKVTVIDKGGRSTSSTLRVTVKQSAGVLSVVTSDNKAVPANGTVTVAGKSEQFKVQVLDQFGKAVTTQPKITWSVTSSPSGGLATVSGNGSLATVTFTKVGIYKFKATTSTGTTFNFSVNVAQTVSRIAVTPGTAGLTSGATQQFTAAAFDQFNLPMTAQPTIVWSASGGAISSSGLYKAASVAGSATISAKSGAITGTATVSIALPNQSGLKNNTLGSLVTTLYADGSLSRTDVMKILKSAGTDGIVDGTELSDLRYVVASAPTYKMDSYVQVLASNVVNTNAANLLYQGVAAGNLAAGSSAALLTILVDKWFMGTDVPALTSSGLSYRNAAGVLFNGTPSRSDELQGMVGDCYFIAALGAIADRNPTAISNMFIDNGDGTFTVRFYTGQYGAFYATDGTISDGFTSGKGTADYVTVNRMLPSFSNGTFAYSNYGKQLSSTTTPLWLALAEKAYAQWNATGKAGRNGTNSYAGISGGWMAPVNAQVLGINATDYYLSTASKQSLVGALNSNLSVTIGTKSAPNAGGLVGSHAYTVTGYDSETETFTLYNPWGSSQPSPLSWAALQANCSMFVVANSSGSTAIAKVVVNAPSVRNSLETSAAPRIEPLSNSESLMAFQPTSPGSSDMFDNPESNPTEEPSQWQPSELDSEQWSADSPDLAAHAFFERATLSAFSSRNLSPALVDEVIDNIDALLREALA